jgi:hypothetical protein
MSQEIAENMSRLGAALDALREQQEADIRPIREKFLADIQPILEEVRALQGVCEHRPVGQFVPGGGAVSICMDCLAVQGTPDDWLDNEWRGDPKAILNSARRRHYASMRKS